MSSIWDAAVRAWLVLATWHGLRRAVRLDRLARIDRPMRFVRAAIVPAGRQVALAIAFLSRRRRSEAAISFLACKALSGFDDRSGSPTAARDGITAAVAYLTGETHEPPRPAAPRSSRPSHRLDALLAARLPLLRAALKALPGDAGRRCCAIIERIGDGLIQAHADRRCGVDHVFGEAVIAAARLTVPAVLPPVFACEAAGRALQLAKELRDASSKDAREMLLYQALRELPTVPRLLRWLPASVEAGTRAAATLLAATTYTFYLREIAAPLPQRLRHPLRAAIAAALSRRAYLTTVAAIEDGFHDALAALATRLDGPASKAAPVVAPPGSFDPGPPHGPLAEDAVPAAVLTSERSSPTATQPAA